MITSPLLPETHLYIDPTHYYISRDAVVSVSLGQPLPRMASTWGSDQRQERHTAGCPAHMGTVRIVFQVSRNPYVLALDSQFPGSLCNNRINRISFQGVHIFYAFIRNCSTCEQLSNILNVTSIGSLWIVVTLAAIINGLWLDLIAIPHCQYVYRDFSSFQE